MLYKDRDDFFFPLMHSQNFVSRINKREENVFTSQFCTAQIYFFFLFFFKKKKTTNLFCLLKLCIYCSFDCVRSQLPHVGGSLVEAHRLFLAALFSLQLRCAAQLPCSMWNFSSPIRGCNHALCIRRHIHNHWTTREVPINFFFKSMPSFFSFMYF